MIKRLIPFIVSAVLGLIAVVMLQRYLAGERAKLTAKQQELQALFQDQKNVIVALKEIPEGTAITPELLGSQPIPSKFVQPYATSQAMDVVGWVAKVPIAQGEQILTNKLRRESEQPLSATLSGLTPEGKRAVTIGADALTGVGGFVRPGDAIDVLWTFKVPQAGTQETELVTMTLFQNVSVLAVGDQMIGKAASDHEASQSYTVTLALNPQETALLLYAREQGQIQLSLRPKTEKDLQVAVSPANMATIMESALGKEAVAEAPSPQRTVEVIRGLEHSVVAVSNE